MNIDTHTNKQVLQSQSDKKLPPKSSLWPCLLWSVTLTWGLSSVAPPGVCVHAVPRSLCVCVSRKMSQRCHKGSSYPVLEKFLKALSFICQQCSFNPSSEKGEWMKEDVIREMRCWGRGICLVETFVRRIGGSARSRKMKVGKTGRGGEGVAKQTHWVSRCSDSRG